MVDDDRGQLILIGALLVAATILGSITLLNTIHESPEVKTQQDGQSLDQTERKVTEIQADLTRLFRHSVSVNETGQPLPYANDTLGDTVEAYNRQSVNLSSFTTAGLVNITYVRGIEGGIVAQNRTGDEYRAFPDERRPTPVLNNSETIPRLSLVVNETSPSFTINLSAPTLTGTQEIGLEFDRNPSGPDEIVKSNTDGSPSPEWTCSGFDFTSDGTLRIEFIDGRGAMYTEDTYCGEKPFGRGLNSPITVEFKNSGSDRANGTFVISGTNSSAPGVQSGITQDDNRFFRGTGGTVTVVNPVFRLEYQTPNVSYNSTFALYNTTGR